MKTAKQFGLLIFAIQLFFSHPGVAQISNNYIPITKQTVNKTELKSSLESKLKEDKGKITKYRKEFTDLYTSTYNSTVSALDSGYFYFDDTVNVFFQNILKNIQKNNPELNKPDIKLLVARYTTPNASCNSSGTLVFNIGLLRYLKNESQVAYVICHELSHYSQNHVVRDVMRSLDELNSKEMQDKLRKIKYAGTGVTSKAVDLMKNYSIESHRHSRAYESQADSFAYLYMQKSGYDEKEGISMLQILDSVDVEKYRDSVRLTEFFDFKEYPFKNSWIAEEKSFIFAKDTAYELLKDSLKTHPDCQKRIEDLKKAYKADVHGKSKFIQSEDLFKKLVTYSDFECINNRLHYFHNLDGAFYLTLKMLKQYPNNIFLHNSMDECLQTIISGLTNHNLNHYLDLPSPLDETDYKVVLRFLNNIRISEVQQIKKLYDQKYSLR